MSIPQRPKGKNDDPFLRVAIPFILSVVMGFTLVLMGFILLALAALSAIAETNEISGWVWFLLGILSEAIGVFLMRRSLIGTPTPGTFGPGSKKR